MARDLKESNWRCGAVGLLWACTTASATAAPMNIYVGHGQMPFAGGTEQAPGLFGELSEQLCARLQLECLFRSVPWRRVQYEAADDPSGLVLNLGRFPEREDKFIWLLDVLATRYSVASLGRPFDTLADALAAGPVAVMGGTPRAQELRAELGEGQQIVEVADPEQGAELLNSGRVVAWYEIELRARYLWRRLGYSQALTMGEPIGQLDSYIAGNAQLYGGQALQQRMADTFVEMQRDGSWRRILVEYLGEEDAARLLR